MTVRVCNATFSDWVSLQFDDGWTDTFIIRISALACLPPFVYEDPLKRIVSYLVRKRRSASIWVQVDAPGQWYALELRSALEGLRLPYAVTRTGAQLKWVDFDKPPWVDYCPSKRPPVAPEKPHGLSPEAVLCLQALVRMKEGEADEIASLTGLPRDGMKSLLAKLEKAGYVAHSDSLEAYWKCKRKGKSLALRSWGIPPNFEFKRKEESNQWLIGTTHNHRSRLWPHSLRSAWPQAEIWTGWCEVSIPETSVLPDALAWGRLQGYETLFWLEVGDTHKSKVEIETTTVTRLQEALKLCRRTEMRLVYTQLSTNWVHEAARWACVNLDSDMAVVMGDQRKEGKLPLVEWGKITSA
ncbi:MAG: MarR family transcriptional regulator [Candidatus Omnitrophica bacterium]|nr:MarR family transcriptional regulator [Candidatus Omnitrophota bacterium]WKZ52682.1 MAG: helix-turn-helix domain-containing protein [Anaerolineales bacterium]